MSLPDRTVPIVNPDERTGIITEAWYDEFTSTSTRVSALEVKSAAGSNLLLAMLYGAI